MIVRGAKTEQPCALALLQHDAREQPPLGRLSRDGPKPSSAMNDGCSPHPTGLAPRLFCDSGTGTLSYHGHRMLGDTTMDRPLLRSADVVGN